MAQESSFEGLEYEASKCNGICHSRNSDSGSDMRPMRWAFAVICEASDVLIQRDGKRLVLELGQSCPRRLFESYKLSAFLTYENSSFDSGAVMLIIFPNPV